VATLKNVDEPGKGGGVGVGVGHFPFTLSEPSGQGGRSIGVPLPLLDPVGVSDPVMDEIRTIIVSKAIVFEIFVRFVQLLLWLDILGFKIFFLYSRMG
jgi:hypothetical protein